MDQSRAPLAEALEAYNQKIGTTFTIPGHRRGAGISSWWTERVGREIFRYDLTETPGTDDLHAPEGAILQAQRLAAEASGAEETRFLVNGTTCGIEAMLLAAAGPGQTVILPRNSHKSALMGLILSGAKPRYLMPEILPQLGCAGAVSPAAVEAALTQTPDAAAVLVVSPTYEGVCSDLRAIAELCHRHNALFLVDEAHGAHLHYTPSLPQDAMAAGADLCVQSLHKTGGALTQSSMLHIRYGRVDLPRLYAALRMVQSTSPSYLLTTSLDLARRELALHGEADWRRTIDLAARTRSRIRELDGLICPDAADFAAWGAADWDPTRLCIGAPGRGWSGDTLKTELYQKNGIDFELAGSDYVLAIFTPATTEEEADCLVDALRSLPHHMAESKRPPLVVADCPEQVLTPRDAFFRPRGAVLLEQALGRVAAEAVVPYPPGIPLLCPGERIDAARLDALLRCRKQAHHLQGVADAGLETIQVVLDK